MKKIKSSSHLVPGFHFCSGFNFSDSIAGQGDPIAYESIGGFRKSGDMLQALI
jgi:hypothetical protein